MPRDPITELLARPAPVQRCYCDGERRSKTTTRLELFPRLLGSLAPHNERQGRLYVLLQDPPGVPSHHPPDPVTRVSKAAGRSLVLKHLRERVRLLSQGQRKRAGSVIGPVHQVGRLPTASWPVLLS